MRAAAIHNVVIDDRIELLGVDMPERVKRGETFEMTLYYKVIGRPGRWPIASRSAPATSGTRRASTRSAPASSPARRRTGGT